MHTDRTDSLSGSPPPSAAVRWVGLVVFPVIAALLLALLAEGAARARQWSRYGTPASFADLYRTDDHLGLRVLKPKTRIGEITINSLGFRGPEIALPKPPGTFMIAFLGASTTFCAEVSGDSVVWPALVAEELGLHFPHVTIDFVNGAVPGYTIASSRKNLQHKIASLKPDLIVIYHATNDFSGEVRALAENAGLFSRSAAQSQSWLERHSLLWELVLKNLRVMVAQSDAATPPERRLPVDTASLGGRFREDLGSLLKESEATGARVAIATFSTHLRRDQSPEQRKRAAVSAHVYMPFMSIDGLLDGYERYNSLIVEVARAQSALLIGGETLIPGDPAHFVDSVHFSDQGSRAMAKRVVDALVADPELLERINRQ